MLVMATYAQAITWADAAWGGLRAGHRTAPPQPVFVRLEAPGEAEAAAAAAAAAAKQQPKQQKQPKQPKKPKQPKEAKAEQEQQQQQQVAVETQTVA